MASGRESTMITVFLVDDHEIVRTGVADLIESAEDLSVVGQASTVAEAMARIPAAKPDIAVLDMRLPDGKGIELCRDLRSQFPDLNCLMLTSFTDEQAMLDAIMAGAGGYVIKDIKGMELVSAIRIVGTGQSLLDTRAAAAVMRRLRSQTESSSLTDLTAQETTLLELIGEGLTNRQIAARMFLAEKTIKNYVSRLLAKLGMERRTQIAVYATKITKEARHDY
ncbi:transcriptional regulatory protein DevR [Mycobacteroides abscessus subsp. massiliense]|uniref:Transcriptional regulatory protein DevR n=2 Tax=Mycobacteroides abscessus TaxID=36809 RepID=A0A1U0XDJ8_9MYCO|nr:transcriptional regulatory protein DevR [Mycobacteroides abscessus subsp. massiliense]SKT40040.1 transcriptional regulatory protein DevR [Mycobacteroides abscessus subsp. massiliense]SKT84536.1 transcriptional regulatory protein DevR [Mycobacteroides abscessus subsp. massiliense]SKX27146.1 transcriptional regulatory protein DevR [Mycobacteroides abscessus subsp. massiliense]